MAKRSFVQINGVLYERGIDVIPEEATMGQAPAILGDIAEFRSTIDGTVISSRSALRDHCRKHDVVLTADLKGLPPKRIFNPDAQPSAAHREGTKRTIAEIINSRNY